MIIADLHSHTSYSHGTGTVGEMFKAASNKGLAFIGLSEHSPLPKGFNCSLYSADLNASFPLFVEDVAFLKNNFSGLEALLGLELDWIPTRLSWMRNLVAAYPFDYVLGSIHFLDGISVGAVANWPADLSLQSAFGRFDAYFREMASLAASGLVQIIAHPDFIKLRSWPLFQLWLADEKSQDAIAFALQSMARHNVALEINTAGLRQNFNEFYPGPMIMRMARELDLKLSFGSDAHNPMDIARDFSALADYARSFGFNESFIFRQREPISLAF